MSLNIAELMIYQQGMTEPQKQTFLTMYNQGQKSGAIAFVLAFFLNCDRFYLGQIGSGIFKLLTCGGLGFWWLIDLFTVGSRTVECNRKLAITLAATINATQR